MAASCLGEGLLNTIVQFKDRLKLDILAEDVALPPVLGLTQAPCGVLSSGDREGSVQLLQRHLGSLGQEEEDGEPADQAAIEIKIKEIRSEGC